ncbi:MAG: Hsp20/alpha crystallin family protein [Saprospiraceae bacterium]|nr:Hsp20/alpha crystallin family protein [Saprospiraceae bacterium]
MNLIKYNSLFPEKSLGGFFDDFFNRSLSDMVGTDFTFSSPSVNVIENENDFLVEVAAPGLSKEDFNVEVDKDHLIISAQKEMKKEEKEGKYTRNEFNYSSFTRRFFLPETVDGDNIEATYTDGILKLVVPKREEAKAKAPLSIKIK